jgi:hypothetical protein
MATFRVAVAHYLKFFLGPIFRYILIWYVVSIFRIVYGSGKIVFTHGSTGDTALIASFADAHVEQVGRTIFVCSSEHEELIRRFVSHSDGILVFWSERRCQQLRVAWEIISSAFSKRPRFGLLNPTKFIVPGHIVFYPEIMNLYFLRYYGDEGGIHYMDGLRRVLGLLKETEPRRPHYSEADHQLTSDILSKVSVRLDKIALINPICYTPENISKEAWRGVASALSAIGYTVLFNIQGNNYQIIDSIVPEEFGKVKLPAHLCPLAAQKVGIVCGRNGGGFNLLHSFLRPNKSLLVLIDHHEVSVHGKKDQRMQDAQWTLFNFSGYYADFVVVLSLNDDTNAVNLKMGTLLNFVA